MVSASAIVTVEDKVAPTVNVNSITVPLNSNGTATISTADIDDNSTDACGISTMNLDITSFDCSNVGANTVTLTITDVNGNTASKTAIVTITDSESPVAKTKNITIQLNQNGVATINAEDINNGSSDNCGIQSTTLDVNTFDCSSLGENTVELTVTDTHGNTASKTATVTVQDNETPTIVCQNYEWAFDGNATLELVPEDLIANVSDNCNYTLSMSQSVFTDAHIGQNDVTVTVIDEAGNENSCQSVVDIQFSCFALDDIITPNNDGRNDTWELSCIYPFDNTVKIFNRQGQLVYSAVNYTGGWTGISNDGGQLPQTAYFYIIEVPLASGQKQFSGSINIVRGK